MDQIKKFFLERVNYFIPSWIILLKDLFLVLFSFAAAYTLRYNFQLNDEVLVRMYLQMIPLTIVTIAIFLSLGLHKSIVRHTSLNDAILIVKAMFFITIAMLISFIASNYGWLYIFRVPQSVILIFFTISTVVIVLTRMAIRLFYYWVKADGDVIRVMIFGAGSAGIITKNVLHSDHSQLIKVIGYIDSNPLKTGKTIEGIPVFSEKVLDKAFLQKNGISEIIFAIQNIDKEVKREIVERLLLKTNVRVKEVPPVEAWLNGQLSFRQINTVKITDLLQRTEIKLENEHVMGALKGKRVMVTGAAGSIGSELVRQLCHFNPSMVIMVDQAETPMYHLENEIRALSEQIRFEFVIANIGDHDIMANLFQDFRPQVIYHAAAYKHVPMMERNPGEAVRVNIFGTKNIADLAVEYHAERFVMISTDKAVNPTNVMGATKRAAEIYIQSLSAKLNNESKYNGVHVTQFITTRFGNVLGSNGSVIPLFEKQIAKGGPVTVTHPDITRYFMTIPEACQLVLEAGTLGRGGEILMFDMGKPVRIADLAYSMIRLSGLKPEKDIQIIFTGLRPGEKLYEELLYDKEHGLPTHHSKIFKAEVKPYDFAIVESQLDCLTEAVTLGDMELIARLKGFIPEYKSNNSVYQMLDKTAS